MDSETGQRFTQEIEVLKTVWGPRVAALVEADTESERPWLATEYVDGHPRAPSHHRCRPLPP
ncbi:hypothetical protein [Streptomyces sp. NRRL S-448]|uniref:hypothetical protein n=1 Tax=Streptomyces sp. NRRL S-448 TaxID=1463907 RepID=UPI000A5733B0